jgi:hypothetical protein
MFFRTKKSGPRTYLQVVENHWEDGRSRQRVLATLGRLDDLQQRGAVDGLLHAGARFADKLLILSAHAQGRWAQTQSGFTQLRCKSLVVK